LQQALDTALAGLRVLRAEYPTLEAGFDEAIRSRCGDPNDRKLFRQARDSLDAYLARVEQAQADLAAGKSPPEPAALGLGWLLQVRVWQWRTPDINPSSQEKPRRIVVEVTEHVRSPGTYVVEWDYTDGQDGLDLLSTGLYASASPAAAPDDLQPLALDEHHGFTGAADSNHRYTLHIEALPPGGRVFLVGLVYNQRTFNTAGNVWLMKGWEREAP
jgi:hypothetical protein